MKAYPILCSTLEGIFGASVGLTDEEADSHLQKDLVHTPFRDALLSELSVALRDPEIEFRHLLEKYEVAYLDTEDEARNFLIQRIQRPALGKR
jgi:hypothetical protein